jgi:hypothetical protein
MAEDKALYRPVLVYPNIHIYDVNWLKATLVCFPRVVRMHPRDFVPQDYKVVGEFMDATDKSEGRSLLESEFIDVLDKSGKESVAYPSQIVLFDELQKNIKYVKEKFAIKKGTKLPFGREPYKLIFEKIKPFYRFLLSNDLVYEESRPPNKLYGARTICLHPKLGDAIMTITAISVANARGYDIVTDSTEYHLAVATLNERAVLDQLFGNLPDRVLAESKGEKVDELAQVIIQTQFDVSQLTPEKILKLHDSDDFLAFKDALMPLVSRMPTIDSPAARKDYYEPLARDAIKKWQQTKKLLSLETGKALIEAGEIKVPEFAEKLVVAGVASWICHPVGAGITVGVLAVKFPEIYRKWREGQASFRFLSRLEKAGALLGGGPVKAFAGNPAYGMRPKIAEPPNN